MAPVTFEKQSSLLTRFVLTLTLVLTLTGCAKKEMNRYQWLLANSAGDYLKVGTRDPKWDALILQSFTNQSRARMGSYNGNWEDGFLEAAKAGCTDPLVGYWRLRAEYGDASDANVANVSAWTKVASALEDSGYSPYRKFYASLRAFEALRATRKSVQPGTKEYTDWGNAFSVYMNSARMYADSVAGDPQAPAEEVFRMVEDFLDATEWASESRQRFVDEVQPALLYGHPSAPQTKHILGSFALVRAWLARGGAYADKTTDKQFGDFAKELDKAEKLILKAWKTEPRVETAINMMRVQLGRSDSRSQMEHWFQEAMTLQTNSYAAARAKYYYIEPKWYGSRELQHQFALECVASTNWAGNVPGIMLDFYADVEPSDASAKARFYANREVWADIRGALEKLLKLNPDQSGWHHNFFKYAYYAGDWPVAARELAVMDEVNDYSYFGGEEQFNEMTTKVRAEMAAASKKQ